MMLSGLVGLGTELINRLWPSPEDKAKRDEAQLKLLQLQQSGELQELTSASANIQTEAKSEDLWVSRARPTFLYVMYVMILASIPLGILHAFSSEIATSIAIGMKDWLAAIPEGMWATFGIGYSGYAIARSYDKAHK